MRKSLLFVWACMGLVCLVSACKTSVKSKEWKLVWGRILIKKQF